MRTATGGKVGIQDHFAVTAVLTKTQARRFLYRCWCGFGGRVKAIREHAATKHGLSKTTIAGRLAIAVDRYDRAN